MAKATDVKSKRKELGDINTTIELLKASGQYTDAQLKDIKSTLAAEGPDSIIDELSAAVQALDSTPEGAARKRDIMAQRKADRLTTKYAPFFQAIMAGGDIATSISQIRQARRAAGDLKEPGMPPVPDIDPALNGAIRDAQTGTYDQARVAGPARQELQDTYAKELALAKSIGGGQASTLGALGQVAALRKNRGAASLLPALDSIRARETGRLDGLINQRGQLLDQNYRNRFYQYRAMQDQYNLNSSAIGALGAAGKQNLRTSMGNLLGAVPGVAARLGQTTGYGDKFTEYEDSLNRSLTNQQPTQSPYSQMKSGPMLSDYWVQDPIIPQETRIKYRPNI
jgi:hypothetical protein